MIWPMANSQMATSKKPRIDAGTLRPRDTKMMRMVDRVTTHTSAVKMMSGSSRGLAAAASRNVFKRRPPRGTSGRPNGRTAADENQGRGLHKERRRGLQG